MSQTYSDVDRSGDPDRAVEGQEIVDSWPQVRVYKARTYEFLADCARLLDVGCGPGSDVVALGTSRTIGVDASWTMCSAARKERRITVAQADIASLPFPDGSFDGVRVDRVVQHVADPGAALVEMVRVLRPGGRVVIADPDQESLTISVPGVPRGITDRLKELRRDIGYRNGRFVTQVPEVLRGLGLTDICVEAFPLLLTDADVAFGLPTWVTTWRKEGPFSDDDERLWSSQVNAGPIVYSLLYFVVSARNPGQP